MPERIGFYTGRTCAAVTTTHTLVVVMEADTRSALASLLAGLGDEWGKDNIVIANNQREALLEFRKEVFGY